MTTNSALSSSRQEFLPSHLDQYLWALHQSVVLLNDGKSFPSNYTFVAQHNRRYIKVIMCLDGKPYSVHAFVDAKTGDLIKSAGYNAPQKNAKGELAVRFHLSDDQERKKLCDDLTNDSHAFAGGYLYEK